MIFSYRGVNYPEFIKHGNAMQYVAPIALQLCKGKGLDVGAGKWPLPGATPVDIKDGGDAMELPHGPFDFIFSSHCLEHVANPIAALEHWKSRLRPANLSVASGYERGGLLYLYLPHPDMAYWRPQNCRKHLHSWRPQDMAQILSDLGFVEVIHSERDLAWGFSVVGFRHG